MVGRIDVEADHVRGFRFEVGIVRLHVAGEAMRLQAGASPRFPDEIVVNLQQATQLSRTPVRAAVGRRLPRLFQHSRFHPRGEHRRRLAAVLGREALEARRQESAAPAIDVVAVTGHRRFDGRVRGAVGQHQDHPRAARVLGTNFETAESPFQFGSFIGRQRQRHMAPQGTSTTSSSTSH